MKPEDDSHLVETGLASEVVFSGKLLEVRRDRIRLPVITAACWITVHSVVLRYLVHSMLRVRQVSSSSSVLTLL